MAESHTGQVCIVDPHIVHKQRCLHGNTNTLDSPAIHFRHRLPPPLSSSVIPQPLLLPQLDSASFAAVAVSLAAEINRSKLVLRELTVASFVSAKSRHSWFSIHSRFTLSCNTQFNFPILSISSSFSFNFFTNLSSMALTNIPDSLFFRISIAILTFSLCNFIKNNKNPLINFPKISNKFKNRGTERPLTWIAINRSISDCCCWTWELMISSSDNLQGNGHGGSS